MEVHVSPGENPRLNPRDPVDGPWVDLRTVGWFRRSL